MKKLLLSILCLTALSAMAQRQIQLHFSDGSTIRYDIDAIDSINFTIAEDTIVPIAPDTSISIEDTIIPIKEDSIIEEIDTFDVTSLTGTTVGALNLGSTSINNKLECSISTTKDSLFTYSMSTSYMGFMPLSCTFENETLTWDEQQQLFTLNFTGTVKFQTTDYECPVTGTLSKDGHLILNITITALSNQVAVYDGYLE